MEDKNILLNHYDVLGAFNANYYKGLITKDHLGEETVISIGTKKEFIFPVKYKGKVYAISSDIVEAGKLPIVIKKAEKIAYNRNVYHYVTKFIPKGIIEKKAMNFRKLIDTLGDFEHTMKDSDYRIFKIACVMLYLRKGFARVVSEAAFGKNSINTILKILMTDVAIINPRSTAAFEHKLIHKMIVLDELTNLASAQRDLMQQALLKVGDGSPSYEKGTRGSAKIGTKDEYDISKLSIMILYNIYDYYVKSGQHDKYFDHVFQEAVKDRYLPIKCEGVLDTTQFKNIINPKKISEDLADDIKALIRTLKYYGRNLEKEMHGYKMLTKYRLSKTGRADKTFHLICQGLDLYARDEAEYNKMVAQLYRMHIKYKEMLKETEIEEVDIDEPITGSPQQTLQEMWKK